MSGIRRSAWHSSRAWRRWLRTRRCVCAWASPAAWETGMEGPAHGLHARCMSQNIEALQQAGAMALLRPLLLDNVPRWVLALCGGRNGLHHSAKTRLLGLPSCCNACLSRRTCAGCILRSIQQSAALALGRLASYSDDLAESVVQNEILPQLVRKGSSLGVRMAGCCSAMVCMLACVRQLGTLLIRLRVPR